MRALQSLLLYYEYSVQDDSLAPETDGCELGTLLGESQSASAVAGPQHEVKQVEGIQVGRDGVPLAGNLQLVPIQHEAKSRLAVVESFLVGGLEVVSLVLQVFRFLAGDAC